jgi:hypothetical protein
MWRTTGMKIALIALLLLAVVPAAQAKELTSVLVVGPKGPTFVEPYRIVQQPLAHLQLIAPPAEPYVLVFPMMRGVPARPGRWYPRAGILCSGWRSGVEAGCAAAPLLRGWLGSGIATGLYRSEPVRLTQLLRDGTSLSPYGNEATAVKLALHQRSSPATPPAGCIAFTARWSRPGWPATFCVSSSGGLYARGRVYPLAPATAVFLSG